MPTDYLTIIENQVDILTNFAQSTLDELTKISEVISELRDRE